MSRKKSTDFLKKLSKADKALYAYIGLANVSESICMSLSSEEYYQRISEFTDDFQGYLHKISLILRDLDVSCADIQNRTDFNYSYEKYFDDILDRLQMTRKNYYSELISKSIFKRHDEVEKIDFSKL